jgi:hypothetical protein
MLVHVWWLLWLVSNIANVLGSRLYDKNLALDERLDSLRSATRVSIVAEALSVVAALLAVYVVLRLTRRVEARGRAAGHLA